MKLTFISQLLIVVAIFIRVPSCNGQKWQMLQLIVQGILQEVPRTLFVAPNEVTQSHNSFIKSRGKS